MSDEQSFRPLTESLFFMTWLTYDLFNHLFCTWVILKRWCRYHMACLDRSTAVGMSLEFLDDWQCIDAFVFIFIYACSWEELWWSMFKCWRHMLSLCFFICPSRIIAKSVFFCVSFLKLQDRRRHGQIRQAETKPKQSKNKSISITIRNGTYPVTPVARILTIALAIEVIHADAQSSRWSVWSAMKKGNVWQDHNNEISNHRGWLYLRRGYSTSLGDHVLSPEGFTKYPVSHSHPHPFHQAFTTSLGVWQLYIWLMDPLRSDYSRDR